ncbi:hypothetical protein QO239_08440 [Cupriavidus taiwanensis]|uniref:hypothetical protein n=1 Tax=Cupriavidus taiwanensis TaxID=164546 RepID=UPI0025417BAE|nr:hypothetical protein [Cupriavidus taiwanensis]MDK3022633.1 hypothetical protein [Cupriavidus taiwanensis]
MLRVPVHKESHLLSAVPLWSWQSVTPGGGVLVSEPLLHLAMLRATKLGPTLNGAGYAAAHATATAALSVCLANEDKQGWVMGPGFKQVKDFNQSNYSGTIGAGLALLQMSAAGYFWGAHWEDCGVPTTGNRPDFVFFRPRSRSGGGLAVCLLEAKGAQRASISAAQKHWVRQIWPNRHQSVSLPGSGPVTPTEGRVVVTELGGQHASGRFRSLVAHGQFSDTALGHNHMEGSTASRTVERAPADQLAAQRASLINVCRLLSMPETAARLRDVPPNEAFDIHPLVGREMSERIRVIPGNGETTEAFAAPFTGLRVGRGFAAVEASVYCDAAVLAGALRGDAPALPVDTRWVQEAVVDEGRFAFRVQGADGVGLIVREAQDRN